RTWADFAGFSMLVDRVGKYQVEEFTTSSYLPATRILSKILVEEEGHIAFGVAKMRALCASPEGKRRAQAALEHWFPRALDMFGRSESRRSERFMEWGLKHRTNAEQRRQYLAEVQGVVAEMGLAMPDPTADRHYE
ncbi:MAG: phenylacetate-CoA oxygenase subunit PaaI, partial [Chloroflexi bacterium]|nr:phenylacetate-CoA oxygenase subunit PaaI [Chloroflexota bacterium]